MKFIGILTLALVAAGAFAQTPAPATQGFSWKPGTSVTREYKELSGTVALGERVVPVLKADGVEYLVLAGTREPGILALKDGASVQVKGVVTRVVQAGKADQLLFRPLELTVGGQTYTFPKVGKMRPGMAGRNGWMGRNPPPPALLPKS